MTVFLLFLFCLFIPIIQSCLVIRYVEPPKCNCPVLALDSKNIQSQVSDHSFYLNVSSRPIIAPIVSIDDCYGSVYCEGDYSLLVFDTESATNFGEYAADGLCDRYTQTWLVDDGTSGGYRTFQRLYATCVDFEDYDSCLPNDTAPLLFAYSNDFDANLVSKVLESFEMSSAWQRSTISHVRFDVRQEEQIQYHSNPDPWLNREEWEDALSLRLPDPSLKLANNEIGSDVLKVIEKFLDNTEYPICGTKIVIMLKRYPKEADISRIVQKIRGNHIYLHISASTSPSGGYQSDTLYKLANQTNGWFLSDDDERLRLAIAWEDPFHKRPLFYAVNRQVLGQGTMELPSLTAEVYGAYYTSITFEDIAPSFPYSRVILRWENNEDSIYPKDSNSTADQSNLWFGGADHGQYKINLHPGVNKLFLEYNYADKKIRTIQIRMLIFADEFDQWIPYDN